MRVNYIYGDYVENGPAPQRGGNGGNFELDTFRINASLDYRQWIGQLEYRWYNGYNFLHTGWLGYEFSDVSQVQVGVTRCPSAPDLATCPRAGSSTSTITSDWPMTWILASST